MTVVLQDDWLTVHHGDVRAVLATLEPDSIPCVVTSPPYYSLRDYGLPPAVWGGDPSHEHEWGAPIVERATNHIDKRRWQHTRNGRDEEQPIEKRVAWLRADVAQGSLCPCGAWSGHLGLEPTPALYVEHMVEVFRAVRRVLRPDGTLWLNLGDAYHGGGRQSYDETSDNKGTAGIPRPPRPDPKGFKAKDRMMIPARVAIALQGDGWWLRDEIVWHKPNPMPSSVRDRTTPAHELVYLLSKSARYHFDGDAIAEPAVSRREELLRFESRPEVGYPGGGQPDRRRNGKRQNVPGGWDIEPGGHNTIHRQGRTAATYREAQLPGEVNASTERQRVGLNARWDESEVNGMAPTTRNKRSVWTIPTEPYPEAHFATFPQALIAPMLLAGCPAGGVVLDPFAGSGTVAVVAQRLGRRAVLIDLSSDYLAQAIKRVAAARSAGDGPAVDMPVPFAADGLWGEVPA